MTHFGIHSIYFIREIFIRDSVEKLRDMIMLPAKNKGQHDVIFNATKQLCPRVMVSHVYLTKYMSCIEKKGWET